MRRDREREGSSDNGRIVTGKGEVSRPEAAFLFLLQAASGPVGFGTISSVTVRSFLVFEPWLFFLIFFYFYFLFFIASET